MEATFHTPWVFRNSKENAKDFLRPRASSHHNDAYPHLDHLDASVSVFHSLFTVILPPSVLSKSVFFFLDPETEVEL